MNEIASEQVHGKQQNHDGQKSQCFHWEDYIPASIFSSSLNITHALRIVCQILRVSKSLDRQLAEFLRKTRGELSYAKFAKKTGISHMTLFRIEKGEHHLTLDKLETVMRKLKIRLSDIFPNEF